MKQEIVQQDLEQIAAVPLPWETIKGKQIFMTGATGFIGSFLVKSLCWLNRQLNLGITFVLVHRKGTVPSFCDKSIRWLEGSLTRGFMPDWAAPDIIIHAASPANWKAIVSEPAGVVDCNILATGYLLECARKHNAQVLFFSSGEVYPRRPGRIIEKPAAALTQNGTCSFYGSSKLAGEVLCEKYREEYGVDSRILRLFSVFGPGEPLTSGRCYTDFIHQALDKHRIQVNGPGTQVRSFCYLSDFVSGLLYVLLRGESTVYNIGNEDNTCTILELARQIAAVQGIEVLGSSSTVEQGDCYIPNTQKLRRLGWHPQVNMQACIKRCLDSY